MIPTADEINGMTDHEYRTLEQRLRRAAYRQGYRLEKSRTRYEWAKHYGTYRLIELPSDRNDFRGYGLAAGDPNAYGYGLGLDDVARFLSENTNSSRKWE